jgi:hypothetical protein
MVTSKVFIPVLSKIGYKQRIKLSTFLNVKNISDAFSGNLISDNLYNSLLEFMELQKVNGFSFVGQVVENDNEQKEHFLKGLNDLIESADMQNHKSSEQSLIIQEQIRLYKDLKN